MTAGISCGEDGPLSPGNREYVTNTSVRRRFGIEGKNSAKASRLIAESIEEGVILPDDPTAARKLMRYVPWWAKSEDQAFVR